VVGKPEAAGWPIKKRGTFQNPVDLVNVKESMRFSRSLTLLFVIVASCGSPPRPNILMVVVDTLRADRLGSYGNDRGLTPFLDSLAARGNVFHRAYAQSSWTSPSIASLFTSRFQSQHGVIRAGGRIRSQETTLAEVLRDNGYVTAGFSANGVLRGRGDKMTGGSLRSGSGFGQGFAHYEASAPERVEGIRAQALWATERAEDVNRRAVEWLDGRAQPRQLPTFLYLHYMEPHIPYAPEEAFLRQTFAGRDLPDMYRLNALAYRGNNFPINDSILRDIQATYDAEVMSVDAGLRSLFSQLEERAFLDDAIIVVTADHGEEFKDHGLIGHGKTLYDELIRVPLLILVPEQSERVDVWDIVSLVDVAPTLVDTLQIGRPDSFEGRSFRVELLAATGWWHALLARVDGILASEPRVAYSELLHDKNHRRLSPHERALVMGSKKLIVGVDGESEFYDSGLDPGEKNSGGVPKGSRALLLDTLAAMQRHVLQLAGADEARPLDPATEEILRALGYTDG
jgi:arylsulfatase A-like enzyme